MIESRQDHVTYVRSLGCDDSSLFLEVPHHHIPPTCTSSNIFVKAGTRCPVRYNFIITEPDLIDKTLARHSDFCGLFSEGQFLHFQVQRLLSSHFLVNICGHLSRKGYWNSTLIVPDYTRFLVTSGPVIQHPHRKYRKLGNRHLRTESDL